MRLPRVPERVVRERHRRPETDRGAAPGEALRRAFDRTMSDKEFIAMAEAAEDAAAGLADGGGGCSEFGGDEVCGKAVNDRSPEGFPGRFFKLTANLKQGSIDQVANMKLLRRLVFGYRHRVLHLKEHRRCRRTSERRGGSL